MKKSDAAVTGAPDPDAVERLNPRKRDYQETDKQYGHQQEHFRPQTHRSEESVKKGNAHHISPIFRKYSSSGNTPTPSIPFQRL